MVSSLCFVNDNDNLTCSGDSENFQMNRFDLRTEEQLFSSELENLEQIINQGEKAFYQSGNALRTIRDKRLYLSQHSDFNTYCRERWDMSRRKADYLIKAANTIDNLTQNNCSQLPINEAQVRPLTRFSKDQQKQVEIWRKVINSAPDGKITAQLVKDVIAEEEYKPEPEESSNNPLKQSLAKFKTNLRLFLTEIEPFLETDLDSMDSSTLSPIVDELATVEFQITLVRKKFVEFQLSRSNGCCAECNQELIHGMESCLCGWNQGQLSVSFSLIYTNR